MSAEFDRRAEPRGTIRLPTQLPLPTDSRLVRAGDPPGVAADTSRTRGFSLVELLVIVATLAIVLGLLAPGLSGSRSRSTLTTELGTLRNLLNTAAIYASRDPQKVFGPVHQSYSDLSGEGYTDYGGGPGVVFPHNWGQLLDPRQRPFNQMLYGFESPDYPAQAETAPGDRSVFKAFQCLGDELGWQSWPGFASDPNETMRSYFRARGTAFRMNNLSWTGGTGVNIVGIYGRPINLVPAPAQTLGFFEARVYQTLFTNDTWGLLPIHGELTSYHKKLGFFAVGYVDGHAGFVDMGDGTFFPRTAQFSFQDVRGTWGRMDCLPAVNPFEG